MIELNYYKEMNIYTIENTNTFKKKPATEQQIREIYAENIDYLIDKLKSGSKAILQVDLESHKIHTSILTPEQKENKK